MTVNESQLAKRQAFAESLFSGQQQFERFRSLDQIFDTAPVRRAGPVFEFGSAPPQPARLPSRPWIEPLE